MLSFTLIVLVLLAAAGCFKRPTTPTAPAIPPSRDATDNIDYSAAAASNPDTDIADVEAAVPQNLGADVDAIASDLNNW